MLLDRLDSLDEDAQFSVCPSLLGQPPRILGILFGRVDILPATAGLFQFDPGSLDLLGACLYFASRQWDLGLGCCQRVPCLGKIPRGSSNKVDPLFQLLILCFGCSCPFRTAVPLGM